MVSFHFNAGSKQIGVQSKTRVVVNGLKFQFSQIQLGRSPHRAFSLSSIYCWDVCIDFHFSATGWKIIATLNSILAQLIEIKGPDGLKIA